MQERIIDGLPPCAAAGFGHNRRNHIDELRHAADFYAVGVAEQRNQHRSYHQRVFKGVMIFQKRRSNLPRFPLAVGFIRMEPDIPFIERQIDGLGAAEFPVPRNVFLQTPMNTPAILVIEDTS